MTDPALPVMVNAQKGPNASPAMIRTVRASMNAETQRRIFFGMADRVAIGLTL